MWQIKLGSTWCHFDWSNKYKLLWKRSSKFIHFVRNWLLLTSGLISDFDFRFRLPAEVENQVTENDKVIYNKAIDKRSRKERAINIRLRTDKITEKREKGTGFESYQNHVLFHILGIVAAVKGSYGFIKRDKSRIDRKNQESRIFFHSSEILDANSKLGRRRIKMGNEVSPDRSPSWTGRRIPTVKLKILGKLFFKSDPELLLHSNLASRT